ARRAGATARPPLADALREARRTRPRSARRRFRRWSTHAPTRRARSRTRTRRTRLAAGSFLGATDRRHAPMARRPYGPLAGMDLRCDIREQQKPRRSGSIGGVSLRRASTPAPPDTRAGPDRANVAILSERHGWSGGVMLFRHPPGSWLTPN